MSEVKPEHPPWDICQACGGKNPRWHAPDREWYQIMGCGSGVLCPKCYQLKADAIGISTDLFQVLIDLSAVVNIPRIPDPELAEMTELLKDAALWLRTNDSCGDEQSEAADRIDAFLTRHRADKQTTKGETL